MAAENMFVETVFAEKAEDGYMYFYWYSIQGEGGQPVEESENYIDKKHNEYWDECINETYKPVDMKLEESLIAPNINKIVNKKIAVRRRLLLVFKLLIFIKVFNEIYSNLANIILKSDTVKSFV